MKLRLGTVSALLAALLALPTPAVFAGAQARVTGKVTDGKGVPLEGVKITVTTPSLTNFKMETKTGKDGKWATILNDATLRYHYRFEKQDYLPFETDRKVPIGSSESIDAQLLDKNQALEQGVVKEAPIDPFTKAYNDAVDKFQAGELDAALALATQATVAGPDKAAGFDLATKIAFKKKDWDQTIAFGEKALVLEADNPPLYGFLMDAYRAKGNKEKAKEYEKKFMVANPDNPDVLYNQAVEAYNKNDFKGAEPILRKVLELKADHANAHFLVGMCYVNLNKIPEMKKHLNEYLKLEPGGKDVSTAKEMLDAFK